MKSIQELLRLTDEEFNGLSTFSMSREKSGKWNIILYGKPIVNNTKLSLTGWPRETRHLFEAQLDEHLSSVSKKDGVLEVPKDLFA